MMKRNGMDLDVDILTNYINTESVKTILDKARQGSITLMYGAKEERFNNAVALKEYLEAS